MKAWKTRNTAIVVILLIIVIWLFAIPLARHLPESIFKDPVGSIYNGLNVLFTALAFGAVVITLLFQSDEARIARREANERSVFEMFQIFTGADFQHVKDGAFSVLLAAVKNKDYADFVASRTFVVAQLSFPDSAEQVVKSLDAKKADLHGEALLGADRADRLKLDDILNFFAMLAHRESSATVIQHCDFAYDWWRPVLWLVGQLQEQHYLDSAQIREYCKNPLIVSTLRRLDAIYGHAAFSTSEEVWRYVTSHPKLIAFGIDERFADANRIKAIKGDAAN